MRPLVFQFGTTKEFTQAFLTAVDGELGSFEERHFPDGETYLRLQVDCANRDVILLANLHQPDQKFLPLGFLAATCKDLGAQRVVLACPYLPYMRQDIRFKGGEGITSRYFARLLSTLVDGLVTIDPHLHRYNSLDEIYSVPSIVLHADNIIANWIRKTVPNPVLVGPDAESAQWVREVAKLVGCEAMVMRKTRLGDREVRVEIPEVAHFAANTPVLIDDIISTGRTMLETASHLVAAGLPRPYCIGIHGVFADDAFAAMQCGPVADVVTSNSIPHSSNRIALDVLLAQGTLEWLRKN